MYPLFRIKGFESNKIKRDGNSPTHRPSLCSKLTKVEAPKVDTCLESLDLEGA